MTLPKQFILAAIAVSFWMLFLPVTSSAGGGCSVPTAQFTASPTCVAVGGSVTFTDGSWPCSPATLNGWSWTFQGGTPGTYTTTVAPGNPPAITYTTAGTYDVSLTVTDTKPSTSGILTKTGYISVGPPVVAFSGSPATICPGGTVYFQDQSTGCPTSWSWTFTGGTPGTSTLQNPSVVYSTAGTYNVKLEIIGSFGTASLTKNLFITVGAPPVANFYTWPTTVCLGATVAFTDQSSYCPTSWSWTFPGGTPASSTAKNPSIVYSTAGTYSVTLMATNSFGSNTLSKTSYITVNTCPAPVAAFTGTPVTLCPGGTVSFTDNSTNTPTSWAWTFPGGTPGTSTLSGWFPAIGVVYNTAGVYDVTLTATNASGSNTLTKTGYITVSGTCAGNLGMNTTGAMANPSAILDISSTTQGMLIPRMTTAQRQLLKDPATGLIIYNTTSNAINFYNGSGWQGVSVNSVSAASAAGAGPGLGMAINATGNAADASATLDVSATDKGLLIPRIWPGSVAVPVAGLVIYNTGTNNINFYNGSSWQTLCAALIDNTKGSGAVGSGISINTSGTAAPDASAILDLSSTSLGLLVPRMTSAQRDAVKTPAQGLIIYNNTNNRIEHWTGAAWYEWLTGTPAAPLASDATSETCSSFYALWNILGGSVGATTYYLDVNTNNTFTGTWIKNNVNVGLVTNYNVTGLSMSTTYYYRVRAYNACGTSTSSNTATGTTTAAPAAPTANAATMFATDGSAFTANWTSTGATNYYLDVNTNSTFTGTWIKNNANVGNVTTYNVTGLSPNTTYYYRVRAFGCSTTSASSNTITVLTCQGATVTSSTICSGTTSVTTYTVTVAGYVSECTWPDNCNSNSSCVVIWAAVGYSVTYNAFDHTSCPSGAGGACGIYSNNSGKSISAACRP